MRFGFRELIFVLLLLAMPVSAYFILFQPRNEQIAEDRAAFREKRAKLEQLETATRNIPDLGDEIDKLSEAIDLFEQKLPAQREVEVILKEVWELAARHKLNPQSVRTDKIVPMAQYAEQPIRMVIIGDFDGFYSFLLALERLPRITRTPVMKLKKLTGENQGQMQADVVLSIFFEGAATDQGGPPAAALPRHATGREGRSS